VFAVAAGPEIADVYPDYALTGKQREAAAKDRRAAVVGEILMHKYGWKLGDTITLRSTNSSDNHLEMTFVIVGQLASKHYPNIFLIRRDYLMAARKENGLPDEDIAWDIITRATNADTMATLAKEIDEHYANSDAETRTMTESDALSSGLSAIGNIRAIVFALCLVVLLTVLLIAANSTVMMVREQISDVAVMRALGFSRSAVAFLLFGECIAIGFLGGMIGALPALWAFSGGITLGAALEGNGALWVTPPQALNALIAALVVSILSGVVPILEAVRLPPALAFRKVV
jgi:putative ABC transport system permease protein